MDTSSIQIADDPAFMDEESDEFKKAALAAVPAEPGSDGPLPKQDESGAASGAEGDTPPKEEPKDEKIEPPKDEEGKAVATPDGLHTIPYSVLKDARQQASDNQAKLAESQRIQAETVAELERLKAEKAAPPPVDEAAKATTAEVDERLESIKEDFPELAAMQEDTNQQLRDAHERIKQLESTVGATVATAADQEQAATREAIDNNPTLHLWEAEDRAAFLQAIEADKLLVKDPRFKGVSLEKRFETVVKMTQAMYPDAKVPASVPKQETDDELRAKAEIALQNAGETGPESLSHIPGGQTPVASEVESMTPLQIEAHLETLPNVEAINDFLTKHA